MLQMNYEIVTLMRTLAVGVAMGHPKKKVVCAGGDVHDFSSFAHPVLTGFDDAGLNVLLAQLGDLFGYCSGRRYRFQMDPAKCETWIKPSHLEHILKLVVEGEFSHLRLVAHATSEENLSKIRAALRNITHFAFAHPQNVLFVRTKTLLFTHHDCRTFQVCPLGT